MRNPVIKYILIFTAIILALECLIFGFLVVQKKPDAPSTLQSNVSTPIAADQQAADNTAGTVTMEIPESTPTVSGQLILEPPEAEEFTITMVGDCTLATAAIIYGGEGSFVHTVGDNYDYPFANVRYLFEDDDFTIVNLECNLTDKAIYSDKTFAFRGPTAYTNIMTGSSVEFASYSNNHIYDYGYEGYDETVAALDAAGLAYCERNSSAVYTTESGLTVGVYAGYFEFDEYDLTAEIGQLSETCDIVIASLHWGDEGQYHPLDEQTYLGHVAIDAGADIVYGHHPHVLQEMEQYGDGIIFYSLGNFSFGGNDRPRDMDSVIVRQQIIREGRSVRLGETILLPCSISSAEGYNNYQPILYEEGTEAYNRVLSKLDGSFEGEDLVVSYDFTY